LDFDCNFIGHSHIAHHFPRWGYLKNFEICQGSFWWNRLVGFLKHYPIYVNWFFGVGYGFGWAALCLNVRILYPKPNPISKISWKIRTQIFRNVKFLFRSWQVFYSFLVMVNETKSVSLQKSAFVSERISSI